MKPKLYKFLGYLQLFIGITAIAGGMPMILKPDGSSQEVTLDVLARTPFTSFLIPGILLVAAIGITNLIGSYFSLKYKQNSGSLGIGLGTILIIWISVQVYLIGFGSLLQPFFLQWAYLNWL